MKWEVTTAPTGRLFDWTTLAAHLRLDNADEQDLVYLYLDGATDHAQEELACSLLAQSITATFYVEDVPPIRTVPPADPYAGQQTGQLVNLGTPFRLPRGPVSQITSVTDGNGNDVTSYRLERQGNTDLIRLNVAAAFPVTVEYTAGYGTAADVPAGIRAAVLAHVGTLYSQRESVAPGAVAVVPHTLADFYRLRRRATGVA